MTKTTKNLGTISIVLGALGSLTTVATLATQARLKEFAQTLGPATQPPAMVDFQRQVNDLTAQYQGVLNSFSVVYLVLAIGLVAVGVGLRRRASWGRTLTIGWSVAALVFLAANTAFQQIVFLPKMQVLINGFMNQLGALPPEMRSLMEMSTRVGSSIGAVLGVLFGAAYPLVLLMLFGRKSAKAEFNA